MIITILLAIIAISEVTRLVLTHKKGTKKEHFKAKLDGVEKMIFDLEFKIFKTKEIREDVRKEYEFMKSRIATLTSQIENFPKEKDQAEKARLEDDKVRAERDATRFEAQMKNIDSEIYGEKPTADNPNGIAGITDQIDSLRELKGMLKSWIKSL